MLYKKRCKRCNTEFHTTKSWQVYCNSACRVAVDRERAPYESGPCLICKKMFKARTKGRQYCSLDCYLQSDTFKEMSAKNYSKMKHADKCGVPRICPQCDKEYPRSKRAKYCSNACRRRWFAERFDRWIANPESVALPQNYDEFLSRNVLPCPIESCNWQGEFLGLHVNTAHGITAHEFKKLCGFNVTTGLVGEELSSKLGNKNPVSLIPGYNRLGDKGNKDSTYVSNESREHRKKARAIVPNTSGAHKNCRTCGAVVEQPYIGHKLYCSEYCRSKWYQIRCKEQILCSYCGKRFRAKSFQAKRAASNLPVACSKLCKNRLNIVKALAARGIEWQQENS